MRIEIDRTLCRGMGMCEAVAPELFQIQEDGRLLVLNDSPEGADHWAAVEEAVENCPSTALRIVD